MSAVVWAWTFAALFVTTAALLWVALKGNEDLAAENRCLLAERYIVRWAENQDGAA